MISAAKRSKFIAFLTLLLATLYAVRGRAESTKTLVLYVEAEGKADPAAARQVVRQTIPPQFVVVDASDFRAAMTAKGQTGPLSRQLFDQKARPLLFERMRQASRQVHADGIVYAVMVEVPGHRVIRLVVIDPNSAEALLDHRITLAPKKSDADEGLIKDALAPVLDRFTPPPTAVAPVYNPRTGGATAATPPPRPTATAPPVVPPAPTPANAGLAPNAGLVLRIFPVATLYSTAALKEYAIPIGAKVLAVPQVGGAYQAPAAKGVTDLPFIAGGGFRYLPAKGWTAEPSITYFSGSKFLTIFRGSVGVGGLLASWVKFTATLSAARYAYEPTVGPPGHRVDEFHSLFEVTTNPWRSLIVTPVWGLFAYDHSLRHATGGLTALAIGIAPYPLDGYLGLNVGWNTGKLTPYLTLRHYSYTIGIGAGESAGLGVRLAVGTDFIDARAGVLLSNAHGPVANPQLEKIPVANLETGFAF